MCFDAKPEVVIVSCGHRVLCMKCAEEMETRRQVSRHAKVNI